MKFLEKLSLKIFSLIVGVLSILLILIVLEIAEISVLTRVIAVLTDGSLNIKLTTIVSLILLLLSFICFFFGAKKEDAGRDGIVLENSSGKLVISKESLENMIAGIAKEIPGTESISSKTILDKEHNLKVFVTIVVSKDIILKEISTELQTKVKEAMKKTADLDVKEVNVRVKNITSKRVKNTNNSIIQEENTSYIENTNDDNMIENETREE